MGWVGNNSWTHPPFFWRHLVPQNVGNIICGCYFLNIVFVIFSILSQIQNGTSLRKNRDYHAWNRIEKWMPQHYANFLKLLNFTKNGQLVFKPWLLPKSEFPKTLDLSMDFPRIFHGFPTPWIFVEAAGAADKKCGGCGGGGGSGRQNAINLPYAAK